MTPAGLWSRIALGATLAIALPLALDVPPPTQLRVSPPLALAAGLTFGTALYSVRARHRPVAISRMGMARTTFIVGWATVEEVLWRWLLLGGLALTIPLSVAFAAATGAFALAHAHGRRSHIVTGAAFGGLYLLAGTLWAPVCAHATYNLLVAGSLRAAGAEVHPG